MGTDAAAFDFLEFFPFIRYLIATSPAFFEIMKDWFTIMEVTASATIICVSVILVATRSLTLFDLLLSLLNHREIFNCSKTNLNIIRFLQLI